MPPGPRIPAMVQTLRMQSDPLGFLGSAMKQFGEIFSIKVMAVGDVVVITTPEMMEQVFTGPEDVVQGGAGQEMIEPAVGPHSIFLSDEEEHTRKRRIMLPPFHRQAVRRYAQEIDRVAERHIASWPKNEPLDMRSRAQDIAMEVIIRIIFGIRDDVRVAAIRDRLVALRKPMHAVIMMPALRRELGPLSPWSVYRRRRAAVDEIIYSEIAAFRAEPDPERDDFLATMVRARHSDGAALTDDEIRDQLMSMLFAGQETTALGMAWAIDLMAHHPDAMARARDDRDYLSAVIDETLRLRPPLFHVARRISRPMTVGGYELSAGTTVMVAILLVHRQPGLYPAPDEFRPERFLGERPPRFGYVPFAAGARRCLGMHLATMELTIVLERLLRTMEVTAVRAKPDDPRLFHITLVPRHGAQVRVRPRMPADQTV
ncbi:cytochrome P450 [Micromonospora sp. NPDC049047]